MSEKKTFKVDNLSLGRDYNDFGWIVSGIETIVTDGVNHFDDDEWDMEVTFTKKQPKPEVGGTCKWDGCGGEITCLILGVNGSWIWITEDPEDEGWIADLGDLTDVKPWQPA